LTTELSVALQLAPLVLFVVLVFFRVLWSRQILRAVGSLFELEGLLFVIFLCLLIVGPSIESEFDKSLQFALLISVCLILARLYMAVVPISEVLEAFFWSGIVSLGIFIPLSFAGLFQSMSTLERFSAFSFHPNLLAFVLAGYFCAMVWKFMTGDWRMKILTGLFASLSLVVIFLASSRGSIVGIIVGSLVIAVLAVVRARKERRIGFLRLSILASGILLGVVILAQHVQWTTDAYDYVDRVLQLSQDYRGLDTGFTGRWDKWMAVLRTFANGTFLLGRGIRSSDFTEKLIDNGYLVILYELGLIQLVLITWRFYGILRRFLKGYFGATNKAQRHFYVCWILVLTVFLTNNIVARFLFAIGNPYSLLTFLLFASPSSQLAWQPNTCAAGRKLPGSLMNLSEANAQPLS
jgi:hypothetical protein